MPRKPPLTLALILSWADDHHAHYERWPNTLSGPVRLAPGQTWVNLDVYLRAGKRGLAGGDSLARLLRRERGAPNARHPPPLGEGEILSWAKAWHAERGLWPHTGSGAVPGVPGQTWAGIDSALRYGYRGQPGGDTLAGLLARRLGARPRARKATLTVPLILGWIDAHHGRRGGWPGADSGPVEDAPGETWGAVDAALRGGLRGLPGGSSLARVLRKHRGVRAKRRALRIRDIREWARAHRRRTGKRPTQRSGPIPEAPGETWRNVDRALSHGYRGLPGGSSLARLLGGRGREGPGNSSLHPRPRG